MPTSRLPLSRSAAIKGPDFSRIVLGLWRLGSWDMSPQQRLAFLQQSLELGITTTDHADIYGDYQAEALFGEALSLQPSIRDKIEIVSKCGIKLVSPGRPAHTLQHYDTSRAHIIASAERSLLNLHTDHLDLLLIHRPDPLMDADEIAEAFTSLQQSGKVKYFGVSNFTPSQFELLASRFPLVTNQLELSVLHMAPLDDGTLDQCQRLALSPMIWSALAGGRLFNEQTEQAIRVRKALEAIAAELNVSVSTVAIAWILQHPSKPLALTGSGRIEAVRDAVAATAITLTREQWFSVWIASAGRNVA
ncbi:aldo/keto reductase family oxidoreductase [Undibacterium sp.]|uniref:aldo/keto reductase n=1 Tax=Undibacterium sp. TaxID=1914977 RepID=UPI00374D9FB1